MRQVNPIPPSAKHAWPSTTPRSEKILEKAAIIILGVMLVFILFSVTLDSYKRWHEQSVFNHMSPAEHLREAKANSLIPALVFRHLEAIPQDAPEYKEVPALREAALNVEVEDRLKHLTVEAEEAKKQRDSEAERAKERDPYASLFSWPTTVRVDSDMDSFWLNGEERTCTTTPGANGRVATVTCNYSGSHQTHNIPITFRGDVDRNLVSDWKCRREGDDFVCRATD